MGTTSVVAIAIEGVVHRGLFHDASDSLVSCPVLSGNKVVVSKSKSSCGLEPQTDLEITSWSMGCSFVVLFRSRNKTCAACCACF